MKNKKGSAIIWGFVVIFAALFMSIFLGLAVFGFNLLTETFGQDVDIGQVNLKDVTDATLGKLNTGFIQNADTIGILLLLGMCLLMIFNGYYVGSKNPKLFFVIDIFLLALFFIPSIYIAQVYETFIHSTDLFSNTYINVIPKTSKFMLNLPTIIGTVGVITMILSYAGIRKDDELAGEDVNVLGY